MTKTRAIRRSKSYPKYALIKRGSELHVAMEAPTGKDESYRLIDDVDDGWFSAGIIYHAEDFETACDNAEEDFRCMASDFLS